VTYFLLENPDVYSKLTEEVRSTFQSQDDINLISVTKLPYMLACLDEALRMFPPVANGLPRVCQGAVISGQYIPENVSLPESIFCTSADHEYIDLCLDSSLGALSPAGVLCRAQQLSPGAFSGRC
jgi:cytochrome P450